MRYDDRLATVLGQPAADARAKAVQWRQLVELLARGEEVSDDLRERGLVRIAHLMKNLPLDLLSATSRAIAGPSVPAELVALFATRGAAASAALLAAADLTPAGWTAVRTVAADDVVPLLAALGHAPVEPVEEAEPVSIVEPVRASEPVTDVEPAPVIDMAREEPVAALDPAKAAALLSELLERAATQRPQPVPDPLPLPAGLFRWETSPTGDIDWVEGAPRAALIGRSIASIFAAPFAARLPFADEPLVLAEDGKLAGEWRWSGTPTFYPDTGRFAGYRGIARREGVLGERASEITADQLPAQDDGLRELMHELRTPLNAIIGFGEIIEGQYLGPAHRAYRDRASEIVRQARRLSDAVDNLDLAARLRSGRMSGETTSSIDTVRATLDDVSAANGDRDVRLMIDDRITAATIALPPVLVERLVRQFAEAMSSSAIAGEQLTVVVQRQDRRLAIAIDRAQALRGLSEQQILGDRGQPGMRFTLRLVQGLATMTGGQLDIAIDRLILLLPLAR